MREGKVLFLHVEMCYHLKCIPHVHDEQYCVEGACSSSDLVGFRAILSRENTDSRN